MFKMKREHVSGKYIVFFYSDKNGRKPTKEWYEAIKASDYKNHTRKSERIDKCIDALAKYGKAIRMPHGRILAGGIWELRPSSDRLLYAAYVDNSFIILHHFTKAEVNNDKMLALAIAKAINNLDEYQKREG